MPRRARQRRSPSGIALAACSLFSQLSSSQIGWPVLLWVQQTPAERLRWLGGSEERVEILSSAPLRLSSMRRRLSAVEGLYAQSVRAHAAAVVPDKHGCFSGLAGPGRPKGSLNKTTTLLKDAILKAATDAGDGDLERFRL